MLPPFLMVFFSKQDWSDHFLQVITLVSEPNIKWVVRGKSHIQGEGKQIQYHFLKKYHFDQMSVFGISAMNHPGILYLQSTCRCSLQADQPCSRQVKSGWVKRSFDQKKLCREAENDGWCQYQAIIQTFLGPVFAVFASAVALDTVAGSLQATIIFVFGRCQS